MSKVGTILGIIGQFAPQILSFTKLRPIANEVGAAMQAAQAFQQQKGESQASLNARRLQAVIVEGQLAAQAVNDQAGKVVLDPAVVAAVGGEIISTTKATINLVHSVHANDATGNVDTPQSPLVTPVVPTTTGVVVPLGDRAGAGYSVP